MTRRETHETIDSSRPPTGSESHGADLPISGRTNQELDGYMEVEDIQDAYERYAKWIDRLGWLDRLITGRYRHRQFAQAEGRVLDVACGAGANFRYLPKSADIAGIDVSEPLLEQARAELDSLGRDGTVTQMDAQALEFEDDSFDTVISSFSTCTFPDPVAAFREMARVCRPDGRILLLEHGRSDNALIARYQAWRAEAHYQKSGCRLTQEPLDVVRRAGLPVDDAETAQFGRITRIVCERPDSLTRSETD